MNTKPSSRPASIDEISAAPAAVMVHGVKVFGAGDTQVRALDDVSVQFERGRMSGCRTEQRRMPVSQSHAVVWLDHVEAKIIIFSDGRGRELKARSRMSPSRAHSDVGQSGSGHVRDDVEFYDEIVHLVADVPELLIIGPGTAKVAFERHVQKHHPDVAGQIVGVETVNHLTSGEILKFARAYFRRADQLLGGR